MKRIVCIGNRWIAGDDAGPRAYDRLVELSLPAEVELVDGGLAGLDLLPLLEGVEQVVFVDALSGFGAPDEVVVLEAQTVAAQAPDHHDHAAGLPYALCVAPRVCTHLAPDVRVVGIERPCSDRAIERAVHITLAMIAAAPLPSCWTMPS